MKKALVGLALVFILLLIAGSVAAAESSMAVFPEREYDFGKVPSPAPALSHDFMVKNEGQVALEILSVTPG